VNLLDENILDDERDLLRSWGIRVRHIGRDIERKGILDEAIVPFLLTLRRPTLFTRDQGFCRVERCHAAYCIVCLDVRKTQVAEYTRLVLRHPALNTQGKRVG